MKNKIIDYMKIFIFVLCVMSIPVGIIYSYGKLPVCAVEECTEKALGESGLCMKHTPTPEELYIQNEQKKMDAVIDLIHKKRFKEAHENLIMISDRVYPERLALIVYVDIRDDQEHKKTSGARAWELTHYFPDDYDGVLKEEIFAYRDEYYEKYNNTWERGYEPKPKTETIVIPPRKNNSSKKTASSRMDPYDVYDYDDGDDFAEEWAEEFGDGDYDWGYDEAYDYWYDHQ